MCLKKAQQNGLTWVDRSRYLIGDERYNKKYTQLVCVALAIFMPDCFFSMCVCARACARSQQLP